LQLKLQVHALTTEAAQRTSERDSAVAQYDAMLHSNADREAELTVRLPVYKFDNCLITELLVASHFRRHWRR
jgi:hypothetical protein